MSARGFLKRITSRRWRVRVESLWPATMTCIRPLSLHVGRNLLRLHERGIFQSIFPEESSANLLRQLESASQCVYCGFDPTADSLHIGNLLAIIAMLHCQRSGHKPIILLGGATALIGDPSGRSTERDLMAASQIEKNITSITDSLNRIITNHQNLLWRTPPDGVHPIKILNNADWYKDKPVVDFLSEIGQYFRMGSMLNKHSVTARLQSSEGMSFKEFTYPVFQAFDWYHLLKTYDCTIQIGGNDQMGNMKAGHDFISKLTKRKVFGLTIPLITTSAGKKLGKTAGNAIWLNADKTSPYHLYQFFFNHQDTEVEKYLKLFTFLSEGEIAGVMKKQKEMPESRPAQKTLAEQVTLLVHGDAGLETARKWTDALFSGSAQALGNISQSELCQLFVNAPTRELFFEPSITVMELCMKARCFGREVDAERVIKAGGISINYQRMTEPEFVIVPGLHILSNNITLIRLGKKQYYIIKWVES